METIPELGDIRRYCVAQSPGLGGILGWIPILKNDKIAIAATDGRRILFNTDGEAFEAMGFRCRAYVLCHEVMHVALRHPQRMKEMHKRDGADFRHDVANVAADAIINRSLDQCGWLRAPDNRVMLDQLVDRNHKIPPHAWSVETLYKELKDRVDDGTLSIGGMGGDMEGDIAEGDGVHADGREESSNWRLRMHRAQAGDRPGGLFRGIGADIPDRRTPWRHHLRRYMTHNVMPETTVNPYRPSRSTVSLLCAGYANVPIQPAFQPALGMQRVVVCIDTSGSISDHILTTFMGEMVALANSTQARVHVIAADADVHDTFDYTTRDNISQKIKGLGGGGGTDFRPAVEAAQKVDGAQAIVYLTDMFGPFPEQCSLPLLWASITPLAALDTKEVPVGEVIEIDI